MSAERLARALPGEAGVEAHRALLPVGYAHVADAYRAAVADLTDRELTEHYGEGLREFQGPFAAHLKAVLTRLGGGRWDLGGHRLFGGGSDVDLMTHLVSAVAADARVALFDGDWWGFRVGVAHPERVVWDASGAAELACLCIPAVRNGHLTEGMLEFLDAGRANLWNLNLFPTLPAAEREAIAGRLGPLLPRAILSISFSRGFGMTASQLGVLLVPPGHPYLRRYETAWNWLSYFHNAIAARAFRRIDLDVLGRVDAARRDWVHAWLRRHELPVVETGSYYVKSFRVEGALPDRLAPLVRDRVARLCFKPPITR